MQALSPANLSAHRRIQSNHFAANSLESPQAMASKLHWQTRLLLWAQIEVSLVELDFR
jgi:hypothetical protein